MREEQRRKKDVPSTSVTWAGWSVDTPANMPDTPTSAPEPVPMPPKRRMTVADAAYTVLKEAGEPLKVKHILAKMQESGLWEPKGETPTNTIWSTLRRDIRQNDDNSLFWQPKTGYFACNPKRMDYKPGEKKEVDTSTYAGRFAVRLRELRERAGLSVEKLAAESGIPAPTLFDYESSRRNPSIDRLPAIAIALKVTIHELVPDEPVG